MVPVVAFVTARRVALVGGGGGGGGGGLPLLPPPPQPQTSAQSIAQKTPRTSDTARWAFWFRPSPALGRS